MFAHNSFSEERKDRTVKSKIISKFVYASFLYMRLPHYAMTTIYTGKTNFSIHQTIQLHDFCLEFIYRRLFVVFQIEEKTITELEIGTKKLLKTSKTSKTKNNDLQLEYKLKPITSNKEKQKRLKNRRINQ